MESLNHSAKQEERPLPVKQPNRSHATRRLGEEMDRAARDAHYQFSIVLVQLEGLSDTADRLGYASGDDVWRRALTFLNQGLSSQDLCCRLSSEEFLLILPAQGHAEALAMVEALRRRWQPSAGTREAAVDLSIGIASYPTHGCRIEELLRAADEALDGDRVHNDLLRSTETRLAVLSTSH